MHPSEALAESEEAVLAQEESADEETVEPSAEEDVLDEEAAVQDEQAGDEEIVQSDEDAGIETHDQIGVGGHVDGNIGLRQWMGVDPSTGANVDDRSFAEGLNKVCIDSTKNDGLAYAGMSFHPITADGQSGIWEDWEAIRGEDKFTTETVKVSAAPESVVSLERVEPLGSEALLVFRAEDPGTAAVSIDYAYRHEATGVTYEGHLAFDMSVAPGPNPAVSLSTPSKAVEVWAWEYAPPTPGEASSYIPYYYEYPSTGDFAASKQWYMLRYESQYAFAPSTTGFQEMFDITIEDESVVSEVYNPQRYFNDDNNVITGTDSHTYDLGFQVGVPGTTDVTLSLKGKPEQSVTITVTVKGDPLTITVMDHDMQIGATQHICIEDDAAANSNCSPITLPEKARYLNYAADWARPFVKSIVSSDPSIVEIKALDNPLYSYRFAPFDIIPLSVGTAQLTLTDCYGKDYSYTVTVKPDPNEEKDPSLTINSVKVMQGASDISKGQLKISTRDVRGQQLTAEVDPVDPRVQVTWSSSNVAVATVDENGVVKPVRESVDAAGKPLDCRITATANGQVTEYCTVVVEAAQGLCTAPADSPLGAASVKLPNAVPEDLLNELDSVALSITAIPPASQGTIDSAVSDLGQGGVRVHAVYDIHFTDKADGSEHAWNKPDHPITVQIPMDDAMREMYKHGTLSFYHIDPTTGARTKMRTWVDSALDHIFFETTHFSPFALVFEPSAATGDGSGGDGSTGDGTGGNGGTDGTGGNGAGAGIQGGDGNGGYQPQPSGDPQPNDQKVGGQPSNTALAQTGDVANRLLAVALLCVSASLLLVAFSRRKKMAGRSK